MWVACAFLASAALGGGQVADLRSPDGKIRVAFQTSGESPTWSVDFEGRPLFRGCRLSLSLDREGDLLRGAEVAAQSRRTVDERIEVSFGKAAEARNRYRETTLAFQRTDCQPVRVVFRCFDDAVAFRYEVGSEVSAPRTITDENSSFWPVGDPVAWVQILPNFTSSHEVPVDELRASTIRPGALLDTPLTLRWDDGTCASITEASLRHYAGMSLMRASDETAELECRLSPRPDGAKVVRPLPIVSPWRVVEIADKPGALLESQTLYCLNEPNAIGDTSWIRPGKMTWTWWNGYLFDGKQSPPILGLEMQKRYIDFCAENGILYHDVVADEQDKPWYHQVRPGLFPGPETDVTRVRDDLDLPAVLAYAEKRGVRLWTWVHHAALKGRLDEAFAAFEKMGWSGMMVDFFDHDDQETVEFAEAILKAAARHHILIHFHGMYKPTGWQRTFPNLMNHEGSRNLEYLKWGDTCPPEHTLRVAFTRLVAGPMDYHLGGFRSVPRARFEPHNVGPNVLGTRCFNLALYVCIDNPTPMVADDPGAYRDQPGFEFLRDVPTTWDETRALQASIGELLVVARRKGARWYLGAIGATGPHRLDLDLSFLGKGAHTLELWRDGPRTELDPNQLVRETRTVGAGDRLQVTLAPDGGFVARISPQ